MNQGRQDRVAVCTTVSKSGLAHARVLMQSLRRHDPEALRIVFLADRVDGYFDASQEPFELIPSEELAIPGSPWFHFKYTRKELQAALKPYALEFALHRYRLDKIIYLDAEVQTYAPLDALWRQLGEAQDGAQMVLMPHLTAPANDAAQPSELGVLRSGVYSTGFLALRRSVEMLEFLKWWQVRVYHHCVEDPAHGLCLDGKWLDLAPAAFSGVAIHREPGYNLSRANMQRRFVDRSSDGFTVDGDPLVFANFRETEGGAGESSYVKALADEYEEQLRRNGHAACAQWPYAHGTFANGHPIPDVARTIHLEVPGIEDRFYDPFTAQACVAFTAAWNEPVAPGAKPMGLTRLGYKVYRSDENIRATAPDVFERDRERFLEWLVGEGQTRYALDAHFLAPAWDALRAAGRHLSSAAKTLPETPAAAAGTGLSRIARTIYASRPDLQQAFPDPGGRDAARFLIWLLTYGKRELSLEEHYTGPMREQFEELLASANWMDRKKYGLILRRMDSSAKVQQARLKRESDAAQPPPRDRNRALAYAKTRPLGLNLIGHLTAPTGIGEGARMLTRAARAAGIGVSLSGVRPGDARQDGILEFTEPGVASERFPYGVNVLSVNADQTPRLVQHLGSGLPQDRYNIGYWFWELEEFPDKWHDSFRYVDEVWTGSSFCQDAMARKSPVPVVRMPYALQVDESQMPRPAELEALPGKFVFLTVFDMRSVFERKNPLAVLRAFRLAFRPTDACHLIVKINRGDEMPANMQLLRDAAEGLNVTLLNRTLPREEVNGLIQACDCLVSLHRSEGVGFPIAEAMYLGKPAIATAYSGNLDFTKPDNSFLVGYRLVPVGLANEPFDPGSVWAEPDVEEAARQMREVFNNPERRQTVAARGKAFVREEFSNSRVGARVRERLERIAGASAKSARAAQS